MFYVYNGSGFFPQWGQTNKQTLTHGAPSCPCCGFCWCRRLWMTGCTGRCSSADNQKTASMRRHWFNSIPSTGLTTNPVRQWQVRSLSDTCGSDDVVMTQHHQLTELKPRRALLCSKSTALADAAGWHRGDCQGLTDTAMAMGPAKLQISVSYMESQQKSGFP